MTSLNNDGLIVTKQDLGAVSPNSDDDGRLYNHDGSSTLTLVGGNTSNNDGYYMWDAAASAWHPLKNTIKAAEQVDTNGSSAVVRDTTNAATIAAFHEGGGADIYGTTTIHPSPGGTGGHLVVNDGQIILENAKNIFFEDSNGTRNFSLYNRGGSSLAWYDYVNGIDLLEMHAGGDADFPSGTVTISGGNLVVSGHDLTVTGPDDAAGTVTFQPGADTTATGTPSMVLDIPGGSLTDGTTTIYDGANGYVPSSVVQGLDTHTADTANPHAVGLEQARAQDASFAGAVSMGGNYLDNRSGFFNGYQSTTQTGIDAGVLANVAETVAVNDGPYTVVDANTVQVDRAGIYRINYHCNFHQTSGNNRVVLGGRVRINGADTFDHTGSRCYIRNTGNGDQNHVNNESLHNLASGDTIEIYVNKLHGQSGNDLEEAQVVIEYLG